MAYRALGPCALRGISRVMNGIYGISSTPCVCGFLAQILLGQAEDSSVGNAEGGVPQKCSSPRLLGG